MKKTLLIFLILFLFFPHPSFSQEDYHFPISASQIPTSSFGEYREGHFHAGLDLKTWGEIGYEVYAIADGYVWKIKTSAFGYGRVLYLRLKDDKVIVYAHLSGFNEKIEEKVQKEQEKMGQYPIKLIFDKEDFPVKKGEIIAYTGETGAGAPHLHFEMRDQMNRPINPLKNGFSIQDNQPPVLTKIALTPMDHESTVNSQHSPLVLDCFRRKNQYYITEIPKICGKISLGLDAYDLTEQANNYFGVYKINLFLDENLIYTIEFNRFSYERTRQVDLLYDFSLRWNGEGRFYQLFRPKGATCEMVSESKIRQGIINTENLSSGYHDIRIEALDINGNQTNLNFRILVNCKFPIDLTHTFQNDTLSLYASVSSKGRVKNVIFEKSYNGSIWRQLKQFPATNPKGIYRFNYTTDEINTTFFRAIARDSLGIETFSSILPYQNENLQDTIPPKLDLLLTEHKKFWEFKIEASEILQNMPKLTIIQENAPAKNVELMQKEITTFLGVYPLLLHKDGLAKIEIVAQDLSGNETKNIYGMQIGSLDPEGNRDYISADGKAKIHLPKGAIFEEMFVRIEKEKIPYSQEKEQGLKPISEVYTFIPDDVPFINRSTISIFYPKTLKEVINLGIYQWSNDGKWKFKGNILDPSQKRISAKVRNLGIYALFADTLAPEIYNVFPKEGTIFQNYQPNIFATIKDGGSGIPEEGIRVEVDGKIQIVEYDYEKNNIKGKIRKKLSSGNHQLKIEISDRAKNKVTIIRNFSIESN